jgi:predicted methyltransferase
MAAPAMLLAAATASRTRGARAAPVFVGKDALKVSPELRQAMASPRRPEAERKRDIGRKPAETMAFFGIKPGMTVAELMTSNGYFTAVLAETVGESGKVYGLNNQWLRDRFKDTGRPLAELLTKGGYKNIVEVSAELEAPQLPTSQFDAIFIIWFYHDFYWMGVDRGDMNKAIMAALKPGGLYGIIDHAAADGVGIGEVAKSHRIEKSVVIEDITQAGFELIEETDVLANPRDPMNVSVFQQELRGSTNQFVLKFRKPA